mmetsp:Transcript_112850/g.324320  ORF Transcript_112850/g.324320 Transcript_112850/m.324320 type:complete len:260 (+) Transcript_112850:71-850(+)
MLVTGGLGGLGLIASFHCATEFENPIITTSRSARLPPSAGPQGMNIYEAIREVVPIYNVQLDVGNTKALADLFAWLNRPGIPFEERSMLIDDIIQQLKYKMHTLPNEALAAIQDFLFEMRDKLSEIVGDLMSRETKVDPKMVTELQEKAAAVSDMIGRLSAKVGNNRSGRCRLIGGVPPPAYSVPDASGDVGAVAAEQAPAALGGDAVIGKMQCEMEQQQPSTTTNTSRQGGGGGMFGEQALSHMVSEMEDEKLLAKEG